MDRSGSYSIPSGAGISRKLRGRDPALSAVYDEWVTRLGSTGAALRFRYVFLRYSLLAWVLIVFFVGVLPWPRPAWFYAPTTIAIAITVIVIVPLAIVGAQLVSKRQLVSEVLRNARLPKMPISDRSLGSIAGYDDWIRRVGGLARNGKP